MESIGKEFEPEPFQTRNPTMAFIILIIIIVSVYFLSFCLNYSPFFKFLKEKNK